MIERWKSTHPHGSSQEEAEQWLMDMGVWSALNATLRPVLVQLWEDGYTAGLDQAGATVARYTATAAVGQLAAAWLAQIIRTTISLAAKALVAGLAVAGFLADESRAKTIAVTELNRAKSQAVMDAWSADGVTLIRWITSGDANVCQHCLDNEAAGPWPLGVPFPSGAMCPPDHPNCRCHLEKA